MKTIIASVLLGIQSCPDIARAEFYELLLMSNSLQWIVFANIILIVLTFIMERVFFNKKLSSRTITFNNPDLLKPSRHQLLLQELKELTELNIIRVEMG